MSTLQGPFTEYIDKVFIKEWWCHIWITPVSWGIISALSLTPNGWKKQYHLHKHGIKQQHLLFKLVNLTKPGHVFLVPKFYYQYFFSQKKLLQNYLCKLENTVLKKNDERWKKYCKLKIVRIHLYDLQFWWLIKV